MAAILSRPQCVKNDFAFVFGFTLYSISFHPNPSIPRDHREIVVMSLKHREWFMDLITKIWWTAKWDMAIFICEGNTLSETVSQVNNGTAIMASVTMYVNFCTQVQLLFQTGWPCYLILCGHEGVFHASDSTLGNIMMTSWHGHPMNTGGFQTRGVGSNQVMPKVWWFLNCRTT